MEYWLEYFSSRVEMVKMNNLPRFLLVPSTASRGHPSTIYNMGKNNTQVVWERKRPRERYGTLQLPKEKGGMALPKLKEYYQPAQPKFIYCCKWRDVEIGTLEQPIQHFLGDKDTWEQNKSHLDVITTHTFSIWFTMLRMYKIQKQATKLNWEAYDNKFVPAKFDQTY